MTDIIDKNIQNILANIPAEEPARQYYFIEKCRDLVKEEQKRLGRPLSCCVVTFGCQMNAKDSEKLTGILREIGYQPQEGEEADLVIYNTCTVRDNANQRVYGRLGYLHALKKKKIPGCGSDCAAV